MGRWTKVRLDEKIHVREGDPDYVLLMNQDKTEFWSARVTGRGVDDEDATKKMIWIEDYTGSIASDTDGDPSNGLTGKATYAMVSIRMACASNLRRSPST